MRQVHLYNKHLYNVHQGVHQGCIKGVIYINSLLLMLFINSLKRVHMQLTSHVCSSFFMFLILTTINFLYKKNTGRALWRMSYLSAVTGGGLAPVSGAAFIQTINVNNN